MIIAVIASTTAGRSVAMASSCAWQVINPPDPDPKFSLLAGVSAVSASDVWTFGDATSSGLELLHFDGTQWSQVVAPGLPASAALLSMAALKTDDIWAAGYQQGSVGDAALVVHWDGKGWSVVHNPGENSNSKLLGVLATRRNDIWVAGWIAPTPFSIDAYAEHYFHGRWTTYTLQAGGTLQAIAGASPASVWAGGGDGQPGALIDQWLQSGQNWVQYPNSIGNFVQTMSARTPRDIWAVGPPNPPGPSFIERWNGRAWKAVTYPRSNPNSVVYQVDATSNMGDVWFAGSTFGSSVTTAFVDRFNAGHFYDMQVTQVGSFETILTGVAPVPSSSDVWVAGSYSNAEGTDSNLAERYTCGLRPAQPTTVQRPAVRQRIPPTSYRPT